MPQVSVRSPNGTFEPAATIFTAGVPPFSRYNSSFPGKPRKRAAGNLLRVST